ncbi:MAG: AraC family transcriptional regulator [Pseudomonadota bacterium]
MSSDPLADIVKSMALTGAVFLEAEFTAPWAITAHVTEEDCRPFLPIPTRVIAFHLVTRGELIVSTDACSGYRKSLSAKAGDVILIPTNAEHVLASGLGHKLVNGDDLLLPAQDDGMVQIRAGGGGAATSLWCGFMASDAGQNMILDNLPDLIVIQIDDASTKKWIEASISMASRRDDITDVQTQKTAAKLSELMLLEALRKHMAQQDEPIGWWAAMADTQISRAISFIHSNLSAALATSDIATIAGMSRSAFVTRFGDLMGTPPSAYITSLRIHTARELLSTTQLGLPEIAARVGYTTPEAFSRAFKRATGDSPARWRSHSQS